MAEAITPPSDARYGDGAPFDEITYLEAKLILKPDRFTAVKDFRAFGKIVKKTAKQTGVGFAPAKVDVPEVREITFFDTPAFDFYNNAFILRRRITFKDGFAVGDPEIVFKFRHPEEAAATAVDVRPLGVASPADIGRVVAFLASDDAAYLTGAALSPTGGLTIH